MAESSATARGALAPPAGVEPFSVDVRVRFSDIDGMRHMNNARYLTFTEEARSIWAHEVLKVEDPEAFAFILAHASIDFLAAANLGETIRVEMWTSRIGSKSWDFSYRMTESGTGRVVATAMTTQVAYDYSAERTIAIPESILGPVTVLAASN